MSATATALAAGTTAAARRRPARAATRPTARAPRGCEMASARQRVDFLLPTRDQASTLGRRAVLGIVVVDELDLLEVRHARIDRRGLVRRQLILVRSGTELLRLRRQRPLVELFGGLEVACALDDRHRADLG